MDTIRHSDYFNPIQVTDQIHIIGVGAVGSHIASNLARLGIKEITIWDFDTVSAYNIPNQLFVAENIEVTKTEALKHELQRINPEIIVHIKEKYTAEELFGYVFLCVDSIKIRLSFYNNNKYNANIIATYDTRIALENGQIITTIWNAKNIKRTLDFTDYGDEEVNEDVSKCGSKLAILPTVLYSGTIATAQFINTIKKEDITQIIYFNSFKNLITKI